MSVSLTDAPLDHEFRLERQLLLRAREAQYDGRRNDEKVMRRAAKRIMAQPVIGPDYSDDEAAALTWLTSLMEVEDCCTPGAIYSEDVSPTEIRFTVRLPERLRLSDEVARTPSRALEGWVQRGILTMLIQSGHKGLPLPVPLIPRHPKDEEASRIIREASRLIQNRHADMAASPAATQGALSVPTPTSPAQPLNEAIRPKHPDYIIPALDCPDLQEEMRDDSHG